MLDYYHAGPPLKQVLEARTRTTQMDETDTVPHASRQWDDQLRTAITAMRAALVTNDMTCLADAIVYVQDVELQMRLVAKGVVGSVEAARDAVLQKMREKPGLN